ncbi:MAG: dihydroorotate dehydrogenase-like protein [Leptospiraceae bacterium]|nr:dihydroorotate dehydrogenase-like protein [Leptospiraceae bacterium]
MDLKTKYLGLQLRTPFVASASPLSYEIDDIKKLEDSGISAVVLHSLFEEQLVEESLELHHHLEAHTESYAESLSYFPEVSEYEIGPDAYLEHIRQAKESVDIPIIASLNGYTSGGWIDFAKKMESAGADAIEMNIYDVPTDTGLESKELENDFLEILKEVKSNVKIPVALKLSPFFTNLSYMAKQFSDAGADALVLFNRFYQPDFDLEHLEVRPHILLSTPHDLRLPLRWIAILYGKVESDLAATGGIHKSTDALKALMAGAKITMLCSVLLKEGIQHTKVLEKGMIDWLEEHEYESVNQLIGSMSQKNCPNPHEYERVQYMKALHSMHIHH